MSNGLSNAGIPDPATPTDVNTTPSDGALAVTWSAVPTATQYNVRVKHGSTTDGTYSTTNTLYNLTGLDNDTEYTVEVQAESDWGLSSFSDPVTGTPSA